LGKTAIHRPSYDVSKHQLIFPIDKAIPAGQIVSLADNFWYGFIVRKQEYKSLNN
jgi:hypothetical protein